jgi:hypothetical protein
MNRPATQNASGVTDREDTFCVNETRGTITPSAAIVPQFFFLSWGKRELEARRPNSIQVEVHRSRGGLWPHAIVAAAHFALLSDDGEAGHDGCNGYQADS